MVSLYLDDLVGIEGFLNIDELCLIMDDVSVVDFVNGFRPLNHRSISIPADKKGEALKQSILEKWAKKAYRANLIECPFISIAFEKSLGECVYVSSYEYDSNNELLVSDPLLKASSAIKKSFRNRIGEAIEREKDQYMQGNPFIILLEAFNWRYRFEEGDEDFKPIRKVIIDKISFHTHISGVLIYYSAYQNGRYIENPKACSEIQIKSDDLELKGIISRSA